MSEASGSMGRDVFLALAAIGWADGSLDRDEADAILRTAAEQDLSLEDMEAIEAACKERIELSFFDRTTLSKADRLFVFAVATWMTTLDGTVDDDETHAVSELGALLAIPEGMQAQVQDLARRVAELPEGDRPDRYDLGRLRSVLEDGLSRAAKKRQGDDEG
jgi:hypothetical protein